MNTTQQVLHFWRKDWQRTWWLFLALCVALAASTAATLPGARESFCLPHARCNSEVWIGLQLLCGLIAMTFVASVVQEDSPTDSSSFWRSQPVSARAMLGAKMLFGFLVVVILGIAAQVIATTANGLPLSGSLHTLGVTVYWGASFLLFSMLAASVMHGTQAFLLTVAALALLRTIAFSGIFWVLEVPDFADVPRLRADIWLLTALGVVVWTYLGNNRRTKLRVVVVMLVLVVLTLGWDTGATRGVQFFNPPAERPNASLPAVRIGIVENDSNYVVRFETTAPAEGHRYALRCGDLNVLFPEKDFRNMWHSWCDVPRAIPPLFKRDLGNPAAGVVALSILLPKYGRPVQYLPSRETSWEFNALLEDQQLEAVTEIPVEPHAPVVQDGARFEAIVFDLDTAGSTLRRVYVDVTEGREPITYVVRIAGARGGVAIPSASSNRSRLSESAFDLRVVDGVVRQVFPVTRETVGSNWNEFPLALPAPVVVRARPIVNASCRPSCLPAWWTNKHILISRWKHVSYASVHAAGALPQSPVDTVTTTAVAGR